LSISVAESCLCSVACFHANHPGTGGSGFRAKSETFLLVLCLPLLSEAEGELAPSSPSPPSPLGSLPGRRCLIELRRILPGSEGGIDPPSPPPPPPPPLLGGPPPPPPPGSLAGTLEELEGGGLGGMAPPLPDAPPQPEVTVVTAAGASWVTPVAR